MGRPSKYKPEFAQRVKVLPCSVCDAPGIFAEGWTC